ncbi:hypothetical protein FRC10_003162 [Ceratobasidium sp. 414]|nr:hypothetical protein FRC10_003162 [Ceratobasidium sp. 414]
MLDDTEPDLWEGTPPRHANITLDTPGAGPSGHRTPLYIPRLVPPWPREPVIFDEEEADLDNMPPGPTLARNPWLEGLSAAEFLDQELEAEIAWCSSRKLPLTDFLAVRGFNYKVKNDITVRAYVRLPRAFHEIKDLPNAFITKSRMAVLAGIRGALFNCCIDSCIAFTGRYAALRECPHCGKDRYNTRGTARKQFRYIPLIPRLINLFHNPETVRTMLYQS